MKQVHIYLFIAEFYIHKFKYILVFSYLKQYISISYSNV